MQEFWLEVKQNLNKSILFLYYQRHTIIIYFQRIPTNTMAVPTNKEELQQAIRTNYYKLQQELSSIS